MKRFMAVSFILMKIITLYAASSQTSVVLTEGQTYTIIEQGNYTFTTNGKTVDACIKVETSATVVLENCHLLTKGSNDRRAPIAITQSGVTLTLCPSGANSLAIESKSAAYAGIYARKSYAANLILTEKRTATASDTLLIRGCSTSTSNVTQCVPPINFSGAGSVTLRGGNVTLAVSEASALSPSGYKTIPALISADSIALHNGKLTAQLCPRDTTGTLNGGHLTGNDFADYVAPLFDCVSFQMTGGVLTTEGKRCATVDTKLQAASVAYDTCYAYPKQPFEQLTARNELPIGGAMIEYSEATFYGLPSNTTFPAATFTHTGANTFDNLTTDASGKLTISGGTKSYPNLSLNYIANANDLNTIFKAPLIFTENGVTARADFGFAAMGFDAQQFAPVLTPSLTLPDDTTSLERTCFVELIQRDTTGEETIIFDGEMTFSRTAPIAPFMAPPITCPQLGPLTTTYQLRAYN